MPAETDSREFKQDQWYKEKKEYSFKNGDLWGDELVWNYKHIYVELYTVYVILKNRLESLFRSIIFPL